MELSLPPEQAARLGRQKPLAGAGGSWRTSRAQIVWHDTPSGGLADRGLALQHEGAAWRMVRLAPCGGSWPPGMPGPEIAAGADPAALGLDANEVPPPIATFEGTLRARQLSDAGATIVTVIDGTLRAATRERRICRLRLAGEADQVAALAGALGRGLDLAVTPATLAAEAVALARGARPAAHHLGAPALTPGSSVETAFATVLGHLTDVILYWAPIVAPHPGHDTAEAVHQMRVALRRLRSALSVFAAGIACPATDTLSADLKTLASRLGPARDWDVFVAETAAAVVAALPDDGGLAALMAEATRRRDAHHAELCRYLGGPGFRRLGIALAGVAITRPWRVDADEARLAALDEKLPIHAAEVLRRRSKKLLRHGAAIAALPAAELHAIRLQAKRLRYAAEFFASLFAGKHANRFLRRLGTLQSCLGHLNDGAVAAGLMAELAAGAPDAEAAQARGMVRGFVAGRAGDTRRRIARAWQKFRKHQPFLKSVDN